MTWAFWLATWCVAALLVALLVAQVIRLFPPR